MNEGFDETEFEDETTSEGVEFIRVRLPRDNEVIGFVDKLLGAARMQVRCVDGKTRLCRVPGRYLRKIWVKSGNFVIVKPWEIEKDTRGDIIYKYSKTQVDWLRKKGHLQKLEEEF